MNVLKNLRLRSMILIIVAGGLLLSVVLGGKILRDLHQARQDLVRDGMFAAEMEVTNRLIGALQRERGATAVFLTANGEGFQVEMATQRVETDELIPDTLAALDHLSAMARTGELTAQVTAVRDLVDNLPRMRGLVDSLSLTPQDQVAFYTQMTSAMIKLTTLSAYELTSPSIMLGLIKTSALQAALDASGLERAVGASGFALGAFDAARLDRLNGLVMDQGAGLSFVASLGNLEEVEALHKARFTGQSLTFLEIREGMLKADPETIAATSSGDWFDLATDRMAAIGGVQALVQTGLILELDQLVAAKTRQLVAVAVALASALVISILASAVIYRILMSQFRESTAALRALADGNLDAPIPMQRPNAFGDMARAMVIFRDSAMARAELEAAAAEQKRAQQDVVSDMGVALGQVARRDLTARIDHVFPPDYESLREDLNLSIRNLAETMEVIGATAAQVQSGARDMDQSVSGLAERTEGQASAIAQIAVSLDGLTQQVRDAAATLGETQGAMKDAERGAQQSSDVVAAAMASIEQVKGSSDEITQIVDLIDDLSFQTNLLALNAGVEAARAGDAGRGFAVVAQEVRALAQRSAESAHGIRELIAKTTHSVDQSVDHVRKTRQVLDDILGSVTDVTTRIDDVTRTSSEQAKSLGEINEGIAQIDQVTQQNQDMANRSRETSAGLTESASALQDVLSQFKLGQSKASPAKLRLAG